MMLRRGLRRLVVHHLARRPAMHALVRLAYKRLPGARTLLRRLLPRPMAPALTVQDVDAMLVFDRSRVVSTSEGVVTVEELISLSRPA